MRHMKAMLLGAALMAGTTTLAVAQSVVPVQWGWGQRDNDDRQAFRDGLNQGQQDARHNRRFNPNSNRWRERDDREAYRSGYERGFQQTAATTMAVGAETGTMIVVAGVGAAEAMAEMALVPRGSTDTRMESTMARVTDARGHSNRPTQDSNYKHADRGYSSSYGNKDYYKQAYRQAYESGYQTGYNSGGGWRRY